MLRDEDRHAENGPRDEAGRPVDIGEETPVRASVVDHGGLPVLGDPPDDALPGFDAKAFEPSGFGAADHVEDQLVGGRIDQEERSEEHTSELQSLAYLVCRLLLEKKKKER